MMLGSGDILVNKPARFLPRESLWLRAEGRQIHLVLGKKGRNRDYENTQEAPDLAGRGGEVGGTPGTMFLRKGAWARAWGISCDDN